RRPAVLLAAARAPGAHRRARGKSHGRGIGRLLPQPPARVAHRRLGFAPEPAGKPRRPGSARAGGPRPIRRTAAAPAALGRLPPDAHPVRVLARPPVAPARPPALPARRPRRLGHRPPVALTRRPSPLPSPACPPPIPISTRSSSAPHWAASPPASRSLPRPRPTALPSA